MLFLLTLPCGGEHICELQLLSALLSQQDVHVELDDCPDSEGGVTGDQGLLHDLQTQGIVPQLDTLSILTHVCMGSTSIHVPRRWKKCLITAEKIQNRGNLPKNCIFMEATQNSFSDDQSLKPHHVHVKQKFL